MSATGNAIAEIVVSKHEESSVVIRIEYVDATVVTVIAPRAFLESALATLGLDGAVIDAILKELQLLSSMMPGVFGV